MLSAVKLDIYGWNGDQTFAICKLSKHPIESLGTCQIATR